MYVLLLASMKVKCPAQFLVKAAQQNETKQRCTFVMCTTTWWDSLLKVQKKISLFDNS
jgi:hypothetical protein